MPEQPWYHEQIGPRLVNKWTVTHVLWGMTSARYVGWWEGLVLHSLYETFEGKLFPQPHRDVSFLNHIGDTLAFLAGRWIAERLQD